MGTSKLQTNILRASLVCQQTQLQRRIHCGETFPNKQKTIAKNFAKQLTSQEKFMSILSQDYKMFFNTLCIFNRNTTIGIKDSKKFTDPLKDFILSRKECDASALRCSKTNQAITLFLSGRFSHNCQDLLYNIATK